MTASEFLKYLIIWGVDIDTLNDTFVDHQEIQDVSGMVPHSHSSIGSGPTSTTAAEIRIHLDGDGSDHSDVAANTAARHTQHTDLWLASGTVDETSAADLRAHLDNDAIHREIDDNGNADTDLWSAEKISGEIAAAVAIDHVQNTDVELASGTANNVSAAELRGHVDDDTVHRTIDDSGYSSTDLWSAEQISGHVIDHVTYSIGAGRNSGNHAQAWLRGYNGAAYNNQQFVVPFDSTIIAISAGHRPSDGDDNWDAEVYRNADVGGVPTEGNALVDLPISGTSNYEETTVDVDAGDRIGIFQRSAGNIPYPRVDVFFRRRR